MLVREALSLSFFYQVDVWNMWNILIYIFSKYFFFTFFFNSSKLMGYRSY